MASQDKWYVNKDGVDIMDVIIADALKYPEGRALKCIIKNKLDDAKVYLSIMESVHEGRLSAVDKLTHGFDLNDEQMELINRWKELV